MMKIKKRTYKKLQKAYYNHKIITCDVESFRKYVKGKRKTIDVFVNEQWITINPSQYKKEDYDMYSHTFHPKYLKKYYKQ